MDGPFLALLLTFVVHVVGIVVLLWMAMAGDGGGWRDWWPRDDDGRGGDGGPGPAPLPDADPLGVRLRTEHDAAPRRRPRRPRHAPQRQRERV